MPGLRFKLPTPPRSNPIWAVLSVIVHGVATAALVVVAGPTYTVDALPTFIVLTDPTAPGPREFPMPYYGAAEEDDSEEPVLGESEGDRGEGEGAAVRTVPEITPIGMEIFDSFPKPDTVFTYMGITSDDPGGTAETEGAGPIGTRRRIGPSYAGGYVWVRPFDVAVGVVGPSETRTIHLARVDVGVRDLLRSLIDSMPRDSFALPPPTVWTTQVDGATWGMDGQWIYLGDFKVPTAALALLSLLPLPQSDYDRNREAAELARVREDILRTVRGMEDRKDIKRYIAELRKRRDEEREAERQARDKAKKDTVRIKPVPIP